MLTRLNTQCGALVRREGPTLVLDAETDIAVYEEALARLVQFHRREPALDVLYFDWATPALRRLEALRAQVLPVVVHTPDWLTGA